MNFFEVFRIVLQNRSPEWGCFHSVLRQTLTAHKELIAHERHEEMVRVSDNFGWGSILRYGKDRFGE